MFFRVDTSQEEIIQVYQSSPRKLENPSALSKLPSQPSIRFLSVSPPSVVVALDLSSAAVKHVRNKIIFN